MIIERVHQSYKVVPASLKEDVGVIQKFHASVGIAEAVTMGYVMHWFDDEYDANEFIKFGTHGKLYRPKNAKGSRVRPDFDHRTF